MRNFKREPELEQARVFYASEFDVMWGRDPSCKYLLVATNQLDESVSCSTKEFYEEIRYTKSTQKTKSFKFMKKKLRQLCQTLAREGKRAMVGFGDWSNQDVGGIIKKNPDGPVKRFE
ncbi:hypothetical protein BBJ28_00001556 [Nothophytophthora sp. Chile5]|nr:hypothetical protein BBJ28_00001556 [Nothophytophthora sp. Chile5]